MDIEYSKEEEFAIEEKMNNHNTKVVCPRCGKLLKYREAGNSYEIKCETEGCLREVVRGI